ncbi:MAG: cytochrome ubiquinol oxidase subunit I, partial [Microbacteriaceae bacterium]
MSTTTAPAPAAATVKQPALPPFGTPSVGRKGNVLVNWMTSTDHKTIGYMYLVTSFVYFCVGGVMAL